MERRVLHCVPRPGSWLPLRGQVAPSAVLAATSVPEHAHSQAYGARTCAGEQFVLHTDMCIPDALASISFALLQKKMYTSQRHPPVGNTDGSRQLDQAVRSAIYICTLTSCAKETDCRYQAAWLIVLSTPTKPFCLFLHTVVGWAQ